MSYESHLHESKQAEVGFAILTLSDTRTTETDVSGRRAIELLKQDGHRLAIYLLQREEPAALAGAIDELLTTQGVDAIITNGGTGISPRDQTIEVIERKLERSLPGFGELFRMLSWEQVGSGAMLSRATAGLAGGRLIFALPGSTKAVELAMTRLILPEIRHLIHESRK